MIAQKITISWVDTCEWNNASKLWQKRKLLTWKSDSFHFEFSSVHKFITLQRKSNKITFWFNTFVCFFPRLTIEFVNDSLNGDWKKKNPSSLQGSNTSCVLLNALVMLLRISNFNVEKAPSVLQIDLLSTLFHDGGEWGWGASFVSSHSRRPWSNYFAFRTPQTGW